MCIHPVCMFSLDLTFSEWRASLLAADPHTFSHHSLQIKMLDAMSARQRQTLIGMCFRYMCRGGLFLGNFPSMVARGSHTDTFSRALKANTEGAESRLYHGYLPQADPKQRPRTEHFVSL